MNNEHSDEKPFENEFEALKASMKEMKSSMKDLKSEIKSLKDSKRTYDDDSDMSGDSYDEYRHKRADYRRAKTEYRRAKHRAKKRRRRRHGKSFKFVFDDVDDPFSFLSDLGNLGSRISHAVNSALSGVMHSVNEMTHSFSDFDFCDDIDFDISGKWIKPQRQRVQAGTDIKIGEILGKDVPEDLNLDEQYTKDVLTSLSKKIQAQEELTNGLNLVNTTDLDNALAYLKEKKLIIQEKEGQKRFMITRLGRKVLKYHTQKEETDFQADEPQSEEKVYPQVEEYESEKKTDSQDDEPQSEGL
ncbi:MAG: hypothetical protein ACXAC7_22140 [Candidatus Hodarchaeales archaeon]|jgi:predicted transcriptional regulator